MLFSLCSVLGLAPIFNRNLTVSTISVLHIHNNNDIIEEWNALWGRSLVQRVRLNRIPYTYVRMTYNYLTFASLVWPIITSKNARVALVERAKFIKLE